MISSLDDIDHEPNLEAELGGKACQLGRARRAGLPVPPGFALCAAAVDAVTAGEAGAVRGAVDAFRSLESAVAVRSSAVGEDGNSASFAGQHLTVLNVRSEAALLDAVRRIRDSARSEAALAYRRKLGLPLEPRIGVVIQKLVFADCAGILFTKNPMTGADERVIEAAWGLGEAVVAGLVTPDRFRLARGGRVLERVAGEKDLGIFWDDGGGTRELPIDADRVNALCLTEAQLARLESLATTCEAAFGGTQDLEWAFERDALYLTQRRAITRA